MNANEKAMSLADFAEHVRDNILAHFPEEYQTRKVRVDEVIKEGNVRLTGLTLIKGESGAAPILYINKFYDAYKDGWPVDDILDKIAENYIDILNSCPRQIQIPEMSYKNVKNRLRVSVVYDKTNADLLTNLESVSIGCGYSLIAWLELSDLIFEDAIIKITKDIFRSFDVTQKTLFKDALSASAAESPAVLNSLLDAVVENMGTSDAANLLNGENSAYSDGILVLTSKDNFAGAAALFYPGVMDKIAEIVGGSYFVLPSSVHEVLIKPDDGRMSPLELAQMVKSVNEAQVQPSEQLGNRVLYYDREAQMLKVAYDLDVDIQKRAVC